MILGHTGLGFTRQQGGGGVSLPAPLFEYDPAVPGSVTTGATFTMEDQGANGWDASTSTAGLMPTLSGDINGQPTLSADIDYLSLPSAMATEVTRQTLAVFAVIKPNSAADSGENRALNGRVSTSTRMNLAYVPSTGIVRAQMHTSAINADMTVASDADPKIIGFVRQGPDIYPFCNGVKGAKAEAKSVSLNDLGLLGRADSGSAADLNGLFGYLAGYGPYEKLTTAQMNKKGQELAARFGISWTDMTEDAATTLAVFGDSITAGQNASTAGQRWANLLQASLGTTTLINAGISGTYLQNTALSGGSPGSNNGRDRYLTAVMGGNKADLLYILYGVNDVRNAPEQPNLSLANFVNDFTEMLTDMLAKGYTTDQIVLGSPPYFTDYQGDAGGPARHIAYVAAVRQLAVDFGLRYADVYQAMIDNGGATLLDSDNLHPIDAGHAVIHAAFLSASVPA